NSHVRTVGYDAAYEMSWKDMMKMMNEAYCPKNEIQKLEKEEDKVERKFLFLLLGQARARSTLRMENNPMGMTMLVPLPYRGERYARAYTVGPEEKKEYAGRNLTFV
ncbi:hypothetical protein Tco_0181311, partial [Tanacetum coccineum]